MEAVKDNGRISLGGEEIQTSTEPPRKSSLRKTDKALQDEGRTIKKTIKGKVDSADVKKKFNLSDEPQINAITYN